MKEQKSKYPASLFWTGVATSILRSFLWLVVATVLLILGTHTPWCGWAGLTLLCAVVLFALVKQLYYRHTVLHSKSPDFSDWQAAMLSPDWAANVEDMVNRALNDKELDACVEDLRDEDTSEDTSEDASEGDSDTDPRDGSND